MLMVGVPVLGLLGILEAGRGIAAPLSIGGEWAVEGDNLSRCAGIPSGFTISQSGVAAQITLHDARSTTFDAAVKGAELSAPILNAAISGKPGARSLTGTMSLAGCSAAFRAVRQVAKKRGE